jgi:hypothetical protein
MRSKVSINLKEIKIIIKIKIIKDIIFLKTFQTFILKIIKHFLII